MLTEILYTERLVKYYGPRRKYWYSGKLTGVGRDTSTYRQNQAVEKVPCLKSPQVARKRANNTYV